MLAVEIFNLSGIVDQHHRHAGSIHVHQILQVLQAVLGQISCLFNNQIFASQLVRHIQQTPLVQAAAADFHHLVVGMILLVDLFQRVHRHLQTGFRRPALNQQMIGHGGLFLRVFFLFLGSVRRHFHRRRRHLRHRLDMFQILQLFRRFRLRFLTVFHGNPAHFFRQMLFCFRLVKAGRQFLVQRTFFHRFRRRFRFLRLFFRFTIRGFFRRFRLRLLIRLFRLLVREQVVLGFAVFLFYGLQLRLVFVPVLHQIHLIAV